MAKAKAKLKSAKKKIAKASVARASTLRRPRRQQYGAIPVRFSRDGRLQVLLLTSVVPGRWVVPKGWPMR